MRFALFYRNLSHLPKNNSMNEQEFRRGKPVVFVGPTLQFSEAAKVLDAEYLPPATQGSFVSVVEQGKPSAILLIDGVFQGEPAVRHKEILWVMARGIPVFGAASMGALRAAELWQYGMVGIGLIFRWYRRYQYAPDDAVAVLHGPAEAGSPALTQSLVDLRIAFRLAAKRGIISEPVRRALVNAATDLNFRDRTIPETVRLVRDRSPALLPRTKFAVEALSNIFVSRKRIDALQALRAVGDLLSKNALRPPLTPRFSVTAAFLRDLEDSGLGSSQ